MGDSNYRTSAVYTGLAASDLPGSSPVAAGADHTVLSFQGDEFQLEPGIDSDARWYALDVSQQYQGPYTTRELQDHYAAGYLSESTLLWADGKNGWCPLSSISELNALVFGQNPPRRTGQNSEIGDSGKNIEMAASIIYSRTEPQKYELSDSTLCKDDGVDDDFKRWQEEIKKAEEEAGALKAGHRSKEDKGATLLQEADLDAGVDTVNDEERPHSPPDGEEEFIDDDGTLYRWDHEIRAWVPQNESVPGVPVYGTEEMTYVEEEEKLPNLGASFTAGDVEDAGPLVEISDGLKRKENVLNENHGNEESVSADTINEPEGWFELKVNTHVYVTGLPDDVTVEEVKDVFSKCGLIKEDLETKNLRIKLYADRETGMLKGDALVTFLKEPSVDLAVKLLDGTPLRPGDKQLMTVTQAQFQQKGDVFIKKQQDKQRKKKLKRVEQKVLGWGGFDDVKRKEPMTVILKNMFTREEKESDPNFLTELEADVIEECSKLGPIERLRVYENSPQGIVMVKFTDREAGLKCIQKMNGRWFAGRQVEAVDDSDVIKYAHVWDAAEEETRLEKFGAELDAD